MHLTTRWRALQGLLGLITGLHVVQLVLFPINLKWTVALIGTGIYGAASVGIFQRRRWGLWLSLFPIMAAFFVGVVLIFGPPPDAPELKFNLFTGLAGLAELPAVVLASSLLRERAAGGKKSPSDSASSDSPG